MIISTLFECHLLALLQSGLQGATIHSEQLKSNHRTRREGEKELLRASAVVKLCECLYTSVFLLLLLLRITDI